MSASIGSIHGRVDTCKHCSEITSCWVIAALDRPFALLLGESPFEAEQGMRRDVGIPEATSL